MSRIAVSIAVGIAVISHAGLINVPIAVVIHTVAGFNRSGMDVCVVVIAVLIRGVSVMVVVGAGIEANPIDVKMILV